MVRSARAMVKLHPPKYRTANKTDNLIDRVTTYLEIFANLATIGKYQGEPCQGKLFIAFFATQVGVPINVGCCGPRVGPFLACLLVLHILQLCSHCTGISDKNTGCLQLLEISWNLKLLLEILETSWNVF